MNLESIYGPNPAYAIVTSIAIIWTFFWKGVAMWRSAQLKQKYWFIVFLAIVWINLLGIVEIIYLFRFAKKRLTFTELQEWFMRKDSK
jgi:hypothetical protein